MSVVAGRTMDRSIADFARACEVEIERITEDPLGGDNAILALLCDAVRLSRELADVGQKGDKMTPLSVKRASVLLRDGTDKIALYLDTPTAFPAMGYEACVDMDAEQGTGAEWVRVNVGIEPEVIDSRHSVRMKFSPENR